MQRCQSRDRDGCRHDRPRLWLQRATRSLETREYLIDHDVPVTRKLGDTRKWKSGRTTWVGGDRHARRPSRSGKRGRGDSVVPTVRRSRHKASSSVVAAPAVADLSWPTYLIIPPYCQAPPPQEQRGDATVFRNNYDNAQYIARQR